MEVFENYRLRLCLNGLLNGLLNVCLFKGRCLFERLFSIMVEDASLITWSCFSRSPDQKRSKDDGADGGDNDSDKSGYKER